MREGDDGMPEPVVFVRTTERKSYAGCRQQWWWKFVDRLEAKTTKPALRFGGLVHGALEVYYPPGSKRGPHPAKTFAKLYDEQVEEGMDDFAMYDEEERRSARDMGIDMMEHYVEHYGADEHIEIIAPEMTFQVPLTDKNGKPLRVKMPDGKMYPVVYVGTFDAVYRDLNNDRIGILETKTAASIGTTHLPLDEQAGSYWLFAAEWLRMIGVLEEDQEIDFILYNFLRKAFRDERPVNEQGLRLNTPKKDDLIARLTELEVPVKKSMKVADLKGTLESMGEDPDQLGEVSKSQPPDWFLRQPIYRNEIDRMNLMFRIRAQVWEMSQVRIGKLPLYKNPAGSYPDQHCLGCEFRDICELHETGADWEEVRDFTMGRWDPYGDHENELYVSYREGAQ